MKLNAREKQAIDALKRIIGCLEGEIKSTTISDSDAGAISEVFKWNVDAAFSSKKEMLKHHLEPKRGKDDYLIYRTYSIPAFQQRPAHYRLTSQLKKKKEVVKK